MYRQMLEQHVAATTTGRVLDIGCGVGAHRALFAAHDYVGVDVNAEYVTEARRTEGEVFRVMNAAALQFPADWFDAIFSVATCHHLSDETIGRMMHEVLRTLRPDAAFHIVDPVMPVSRRAWLKRSLFVHDRGRFQRTVFELTSLLARHGRVDRVDVRAGALHDVCYVRIVR
jgi:SAM-dependent methyltransferase